VSKLGTPAPSTRQEHAAAALSRAMGNGEWAELYEYEQKRFVRLATACLDAGDEVVRQTAAAKEKKGT